MLQRKPALLLFFLTFALLTGGAAYAQSVDADGLPWWNRTVFYQVFVRSFADAQDGPLACDGIGDLQGLIDRLDYLNDGDPNTTDDLGVTGLWLMPIMQSPSYHGYDVLDYYAVEQDYGTNEDFKRLVEEAHRRGIRVILDLVINHVADGHPWFADAFEDLGYRDWFIWSEDKKDYKGPWGQTVWHERVGVHYYGIFGPHMPDLNFRNPAVTEEIHRISRFWLDEMGIDGFRLDAIRHLIEDGPIQENAPETHDWLRRYFTFYKSVDPEAMTVGEVWDASENVAPYITDKELDLAFEFDLAGAFLEAVQTGLSTPLAAQQAETWVLFPPHQYASFLRNHDQSRTMTVLGGDWEDARLAATLLLTSPGVPFLYYGEEIGMYGDKPDPDIRTPMQWTPGDNAGFSACKPWRAVNAGYEAANVETEAADPASLFNQYRRLIHLRKAHPALQVGDYVPVQADVPQVYAFLRQAAGEAALVVVNLGTEPVERYALALPASDLRGRLQAREVLEGVAVKAPRVNRQGGFRGYRPVGGLAPRTGYVVRLTGRR